MSRITEAELLTKGYYLDKNGIFRRKPKETVVEPVPINQPLEITKSKDECKLNKTESAYLEWLKRNNFQWIGVQNITLKLADDCRYTPDFFSIDNGKLQAREVKGFFRDDAKVKIKVAARLFPWIEFIVVRLEKGNWMHSLISP